MKSNYKTKVSSKRDSKSKTKLIFNTYVAKKLLNMGNPIIDLLKDYNRRDGVVCVFMETEKFKRDFADLNRELYNKNTNRFKTKTNYSYCTQKY